MIIILIFDSTNSNHHHHKLGFYVYPKVYKFMKW